MSNDTGMTETVVSTNKDLNYPFLNSGSYAVRLIATNGACSDTSEKFYFEVSDPVMDGTVQLSEVECYQSTKLRLRMYVCNAGFSNIPKGTPVSFYDRDPRLPGAVKLDTTLLLPDEVLGGCCGPVYTVILDIGKPGLNTLWAVFNDAGTALPVILPNTTILEKDLRNNFSVITGFQLKASVTPPSATLQPGDTLQLLGNAVPGINTYLWSPVTNLSCNTCKDPVFVAKKNDVRLKLETRNSWGCVDSAFADIKVPPADDVVIKINSIDCAAGDSLRVNFEICNNFRRGTLSKGLKTSFYDGDPAAGGKLMGPVFSVPSDVNAMCASYSHVIKGAGKQKIYVVVNDKGVVPFILPNDSIMLESNYVNNLASFDYVPEEVKIVPADTTVLKGSSLNLSIASSVYDPSSIRWNSGAGYSLSCTICPVPRVSVNANSIVTMQMLNRYGCFIKGSALLKILPPDLTIRITGTECYSDKKTLVRFRICMNNGYDSLFKNIPVAFYGEDGRKIDSFVTQKVTAGNCDSFSAIINSPETDLLAATVNPMPNNVFEETNLLNNVDTTRLVRFSVTVIPPDSVIYRNSEVRLFASASGGTLTSYSWKPDQFLSCVNCLDPLVKLPYSQSFVFTGKNQYSCFASDTSVLTMYTDGPVNIPNAFTPNGDGKNDVFYILGSRDIELVKDLSVYDRYGQRIFQVRNAPPNDPSYGWRGQVLGKNAATGTFVYAVTIRFVDGTERLFKGTITLIR
jgi:gliding motility-associated-like protein